MSSIRSPATSKTGPGRGQLNKKKREDPFAQFKVMRETLQKECLNEQEGETRHRCASGELELKFCGAEQDEENCVYFKDGSIGPEPQCVDSANDRRIREKAKGSQGGSAMTQSLRGNRNGKIDEGKLPSIQSSQLPFKRTSPPVNASPPSFSSKANLRFEDFIPPYFLRKIIPVSPDPPLMIPQPVPFNALPIRLRLFPIEPLPDPQNSPIDLASRNRDLLLAGHTLVPSQGSTTTGYLHIEGFSRPLLNAVPVVSSLPDHPSPLRRASSSASFD